MQPLPSALATARAIDDIRSIAYPEGIQSPKVELNVNSLKGKFKYDRDFLLQFMAVCKVKPDNLAPLDAIGLVPVVQVLRMAPSMQKPLHWSRPIGLPVGTAGKGNSATKKRSANVEKDSPVTAREVTALLNTLTTERFDSISDQIIEWANKSEEERDGQTLIQVIRLVFEKATDGEEFSVVCARLCQKMMEQISTKVQDDGIINYSEGKPIAGKHLFRIHFRNRCQEDLERGWSAKETATATATEDAAVREATSKTKEGGKADDGEEFELYSDEYYTATKAKRRALGLIRFIGELFKLQMATERIMHECIKKMVGNVENPQEEELERLCTLLTTVGVGSIVDTPKRHGHMDVYISRLAKSEKVNPRLKSSLQLSSSFARTNGDRASSQPADCERNVTPDTYHEEGIRERASFLRRA
ncbi:ARM repeat-containing protein [Peniophora sp. CONT]|nr:ARM repeat-containing protein [Peniophora sp. CONT]